MAMHGDPLDNADTVRCHWCDRPSYGQWVICEDKLFCSYGCADLWDRKKTQSDGQADG